MKLHKITLVAIETPTVVTPEVTPAIVTPMPTQSKMKLRKVVLIALDASVVAPPQTATEEEVAPLVVVVPSLKESENYSLNGIFHPTIAGMYTPQQWDTYYRIGKRAWSTYCAMTRPSYQLPDISSRTVLDRDRASDITQPMPAIRIVKAKRYIKGFLTFVLDTLSFFN